MTLNKINDTVSLLTLLVAPQDNQHGSNGSNNVLLSLQTNMESVENCFKNNPKLNYLRTAVDNMHLGSRNQENSIGIKFTHWSLKLLLYLHEILTEANEVDSEINKLSIQQRTVVSSCVQFVIGLGIVPNLLPGVGIPIARRSGHQSLIQELSDKSASTFERFFDHMECVSALLKCIGHSELAEIILRYTSDILASLLQLCYIPCSKVLPDVNAEPKQTEDLLKAKETCKLELFNFLKKLQGPCLVKELLFLQGNSQISASPTPNWLRQSCSKHLSELLIQPLGVEAVVCGILTNDNESEIADWRKSEIVAKLIVQCRLPTKSVEEHYALVGSQVVDLLHVRNVERRQLYLKVVVNIFTMATKQQPKFSWKYFWMQLLKPLLFCSQQEQTADTVIEEDILTRSLDDLYQLFLLGLNPDPVLLQQLHSVIAILFRLFVHVYPTISHLRGTLQSLFVAYLKQSNEVTGANCLKQLLLEERLDGVLPWNSNLTIENGDCGGVQVTQNKVESESSWLEETVSRTEAVMSLLHLLHNDSFVSTYFLILLETFTIFQTTLSESEPVDKLSSDEQKHLIEIENKMEEQETEFKKCLLVLQMLGMLTEDSQLQDILIQNKTACLKILELNLKRSANCCKTGEDVLLDVETLTLTMTLVILVMSQELMPEHKLQLKNLVPHLKVLLSTHLDDSVRVMANELHVAIMTDGMVMPSSKMSEINQHEQTKSSISNFQKAIAELKDPVLPVRGHALLTLKRLINEKDNETLLHKFEILEIFQENLKDDDTYIYLAAVQGLASLALHFPDAVVARLCAEFADFNTLKNETKTDVEARLKFGEVLIKITQALGDLLPKYREAFLNAFLSGCTDEDFQIRASSLSNLGEVCKGLKFSIGPYIHEIMNCLSSLLKTDPAVEVKRACLHVITLLLRGLGKDIFQVLDSVLRDLYRLVKVVYSTEKDDVVKLHAQLALEELDIIVRSFAFPTQTLTKKISILELP